VCRVCLLVAAVLCLYTVRAYGITCWEAMQALGYNDTYHHGEEARLPKLPGYRRPSKSKVFLLGKGGEAKVYRIERSNGRSSIIRAYHTEFGIDAQERQMSNLKDFTLLRQRLAGREDAFRIPEVLDGMADKNQPWIEIGDTQGYLLWDIFERLGPEHPVSQQLVALFNERALATKKAFPEAWVDEVNEFPPFDDFHIILPGTVLIMTPTNVIVNPETLEMTLIDPL